MGETRHIEGVGRVKGETSPGARAPGFLPNDWAPQIPGALYHRRLRWQSAGARPCRF
jgi:hypothetical protein